MNIADAGRIRARTHADLLQTSGEKQPVIIRRRTLTTTVRCSTLTNIWLDEQIQASGSMILPRMRKLSFRMSDSDDEAVSSRPSSAKVLIFLHFIELGHPRFQAQIQAIEKDLRSSPPRFTLSSAPTLNNHIGMSSNQTFHRRSQEATEAYYLKGAKAIEARAKEELGDEGTSSRRLSLYSRVSQFDKTATHS